MKRRRFEKVLIFPSKSSRFIGLPSSKFKFNRKVKRIWIDIGSDWTSFSSRSFAVWPTLSWTAGRSSADEYRFSKDLGVVAVDANTSYIPMLRRLRRTIPIAAAVTEEEGTIFFHHYSAPGASSVLLPGSSVKGSPGIPDSCVEIVHSEEVTSIRLDAILSKVPDSLEIQFLKVDTQGNDLKVIKSAGNLIKRVQIVMLEVQDTRGGHPDFYQGQDGYDDALEWMAGLGFELNSELSWLENVDAKEWNLVFENLNLGPIN